MPAHRLAVVVCLPSIACRLKQVGLVSLHDYATAACLSDKVVCRGIFLGVKGGPEICTTWWLVWIRHLRLVVV
jgi:hypothetical protein